MTIWKLMIALVIASVIVIFTALQLTSFGNLRTTPSQMKSSPTQATTSLKPKNQFDLDTPSGIFDYLKWTNRSSCSLTHDIGGRMMRNPSGMKRQKALCLDPPELAPQPGHCLVYSIGINNEWTFEDAMGKYGCQVYAFDPSMKANDHDRNPSIHFLKLAPYAQDTYGIMNTTEEKKRRKKLNWRFLALPSVYRMLKSKHGDMAIDYLKLDIEYDEWAILPDLLRTGFIDRVRQLGVEIHLPATDGLIQLKKRVEIIRSLEQYGMIRFDSKYDPWYRGSFQSLNGRNASRGYEIAWYNSKYLVSSSNRVKL